MPVQTARSHASPQFGLLLSRAENMPEDFAAVPAMHEAIDCLQQVRISFLRVQRADAHNMEPAGLESGWPRSRHLIDPIEVHEVRHDLYLGGRQFKIFQQA